jgi:hypothetical protein
MMRQFQTVSCGDTEIDPTEACDEGALNGTLYSCCTASCDLVTGGSLCDDGNACTVADQCQAETCVGTAVAPPGEVPALAFGADGITVSWDPIPGALPGTLYDASRGLVGELPVGSGAGEMCLAGGIPDSHVTDDDAPALNHAFWYLVRGRHTCGAGTYGKAWTSGAPGAERITGVCP